MIGPREQESKDCGAVGCGTGSPEASLLGPRLPASCRVIDEKVRKKSMPPRGVMHLKHINRED
jgi:hypothetical protein